MDAAPRNIKVLYVDDEKHLLSSFTSLLRKEDIQTFVLDDPTQIEVALARDGPFALVVSDQRMPGKDGAAVLETVARLTPDTIRILMTGFADMDATLRAINKGGISRYISKPWNDEDLRGLVRDCVERYNLGAQNEYLLGRMREQNAMLEKLLEGTVAQTVRILGDLVGYINAEIGAFSERTRRRGEAALTLFPELEPAECWDIKRSLDLFCLGLAVLPAWVQISISKQGLGALDRFPEAKKHHLFAATLLQRVPQFENVARIIKFLDRDYDGNGEPTGEPLRGKDIPFGARLLHILIDIERNTSANFKGTEILERLARRPSKYDPEIIERMLGAPPTSPRRTEQMRVAVEQLRPGMTLVDDLVTKAGYCLLAAPLTLTDTAVAMALQWHSSDPITGPIRVLPPQ